MAGPMFSIIVVSLNAGEKLLSTMESIRGQSFWDYEVIVKDAGSKDGSVERLKEWLEGPEATKQDDCFGNRVILSVKPDRGIYDGMNQAAGMARGQYLYFLNCGDLFYGDEVLKTLAAAVGQVRKMGNGPLVFYGDIYDVLHDSRITSNPRLDGFACYRNLPCHQACLYDRGLFAQRGYELKYKVRADYEHFLWCIYQKKAEPVYVPLIIACYEGGGFSETTENRKLSKQEHREITALYMGSGERFRYRLILLLTLAPLRTWMAHSPVLSGFYNKCKTLLYSRKA